MREQQLQAKKIKELERQGYYVIKLSRTNKNGIPDLLAIPPNSDVLFVEVKAAGGRLSELQKYRQKELAEHGLKVEVFKEPHNGKRKTEKRN